MQMETAGLCLNRVCGVPPMSFPLAGLIAPPAKAQGVLLAASGSEGLKV